MFRKLEVLQVDQYQEVINIKGRVRWKNENLSLQVEFRRIIKENKGMGEVIVVKRIWKIEVFLFYVKGLYDFCEGKN